MKWYWVDAFNLACDYAKENPGTDIEKLTAEIWQDMQAENAD